MKNFKRFYISLLFVPLLAACQNNNSPTKQSQSDNNPVVKSTTSEATTQQAVKKDNSLLELLNTSAKSSKSTDEIYVTGDVTVGENGDVKPGIYDLEITGGSGNISGKRKNATLLFINFVGVLLEPVPLSLLK